METKECSFSGVVINGFVMLILDIIMLLAAGYLAVIGIVKLDNYDYSGTYMLIGGILLGLLGILTWRGFVKIEPNEACVMMFFGQYKGTFTKVGFNWVNPFIVTKRLSFRARNIDAEPIKVNDKMGNPVMIGMVLVWKLKDTYKAIFEIDSETMAGGAVTTNKVNDLMRAFERFVKIQATPPCAKLPGCTLTTTTRTKMNPKHSVTTAKKSTNYSKLRLTSVSTWQA